MTPDLRLLLAALVLGGWIALVLSGVVLGGAIHLLAVAAIAIAPWGSARRAPGP